MFAKFFTFFVFMVFSVSSIGAEIKMVDSQGGRISKHVMSLSGEIEEGDAEDFVAFLFNQPKDRLPIRTLMIGKSPGGNLDVAMDIGRVVRDLNIRVLVYDDCYSACAIIALSAVSRMYVGDIGLHRPYYNRDFYSDLSTKDARKWYSEMEGKVKFYLRDNGVSENVISKMFSVSSTDMLTFSPGEAERYLGTYHPYFEELAISNCSKRTKNPDPYIGVDSECLERFIMERQMNSFMEMYEMYWG